MTDTCQARSCTGGNPPKCAFGASCSAGACIDDPITVIKSTAPDEDDEFGWSVALSADGNTLAVGADGEASNATGINGNPNDSSTAKAGAVYLFTRSFGAWSQEAYVKPPNFAAFFGNSVALSADGDTLAVGAFGESSNAAGINGIPDDSFSAFGSGAVYVY
jgi:hypothetical protein